METPTIHMEHNLTTDKKLTPQFFFVTLGMFIALLVTSISVVQLLFGALDKLLPDVLNSVYTYGYQSYNYNTIRTTIATLIIFFPVYLALSYYFNKLATEKILTYYNAVLKKWVLYIILFAAVLTTMIDLSVLIRYFVSGEITTRFIWKVVAILLVSGTIFAYYYLKLKNKASKGISYVFVVLGVIYVVISVVLGFSVIGSPKTQRQLQFDQRRIDDLSNIQSQILSFYQQKKRLPERMDELVDPLQSYVSLPKDPEFMRGATYQYTRENDTTFKLCATFSLPLPKDFQPLYTDKYQVAQMDIAVSSAPVGGFTEESWDHQAGYSCFTRTIDPQRYPFFDDTRPVMPI